MYSQHADLNRQKNPWIQRQVNWDYPVWGTERKTMEKKKKDRTSRTSEILSRVLLVVCRIGSPTKSQREEGRTIFEDIMTKILLNLMNLESSNRKVPHNTYIWASIRLTTDFSSETMDARRLYITQSAKTNTVHQEAYA